MRRILAPLLFALFAVGCKPPLRPVFVDLARVPLLALPEAPAEIRAARPPSLPQAQESLSGLAGAQIALSESSQRIASAQALLAENREAALKGLERALRRVYTRRAEAERSLAEQGLLKDSEARWGLVQGELHAMLQAHAKTRMPLQNLLALLVGFPSPNPETRPRPENPRDARFYDAAARAWKGLLAADQAFAKDAQALVDRFEAEETRRKAQIELDFGQALQAAASQSQAEARAAVQTSLPDFEGSLVQSGSVTLPPIPGGSHSWGPVASPAALSVPLAKEPRLEKEFLMQELSIWMAQNGYRRVERSAMGPDRTKEFAAWIRARRAGL